MDRKFIIAAIIVLLALLVGMIMLTSGVTREDTMINFSTNSSLKNGDAVKFQLTDSNGNPIADAEVIIALDHNGTVERYSISTDGNGTGSLVLNELDAGEYKVNVTYAGNNKYNPSSSAQAIIVGEGTSDAPTQSYGSSGQQSYSNSQDSSSSSSSTSSSSGSSSSNDAGSSDVYDYGGAPSVSVDQNPNGTG